MHGDTILLLSFVLALVAAFAGGLLARVLHLPTIVGYLAGGLVVGPFTPGFAGDSAAMSQLAEVGIMFLMFGTGLHFSLRDLLEVKAVAVPGAVLQITLGTLAGFALARAFGWAVAAGVLLGLSVSIASTVVLIRNLTDQGLYQSRGGRVATGWLIVEDLATVMILVVLPVVFGPGEVHGARLVSELGVAIAKTVAFIAIMLMIGSRVLPWLLRGIARFCPREMFQLAVVVIALGTATAASVLFDLSVALGAFLAGLVVSTSKLSHRVAAESIPLQDLFSILFFASVGMMVDPLALSAHLVELACLVALIVAGKWAINMLLGVALSAGLRTSLTVAAGLSQIGEFSFIIGQTGMALGVLDADQYTLILGASVLSIALNSSAFGFIDLIERRMQRWPGLAALYERNTRPLCEPSRGISGHVAVIGYGAAGHGVTEVLQNLGIPCLVVERDLEAAEEAEEAGFPVLVGDAANSEILDHAHLDRARVLAITIRREPSAEKIIRDALRRAGDLSIVVRADSEDGVRSMIAAGARDVVRPELEGGIEIMRHTLIDLGFRSKQIQCYANDLRESGYEALGDDARAKRLHAFERLLASLSGADMHWIDLGERSAAAGQTLASLDLRARTGATAVALRRGQNLELFLDPETVLRVGDSLGLICTPDELDQAEEVLNRPCECADGTDFPDDAAAPSTRAR
ncbi:sodium/hydrogen exchanger [Coriobacterium glomerans PW2]|uniref:Sodium/hydrogen exchanger n=1 Tax=Coriobacterium glomerans (strain ATCC 49209 / DSM 20642 / JCM 10262 / PW2) TaxID=700015 RepID=F2NB78_CORGP|nr:cation:proton antiporter [Coriobacterium glomerans]AEB07829.1 sodium/hydrogen exchanger [Coriobacterium glomerans PW2]